MDRQIVGYINTV